MNNETQINQGGQINEQVSGTSVLPSGSALMSETWGLYRSKLATLIGVAIVPALVMFLFVNFLNMAPEQGGQGGAMLAGWFSFFILAVLVQIIVYAWGQIAIIEAVSETGEITVAESFGRAKRKIGSYIWLIILSSFFVMGGSLLFIIPGMIFGIWFVFGVYIIVCENEKGFRALLKSREYMRSRTFKVLWRLFVVGFAALIGSVVLNVAFMPFGKEMGASIARLLFAVVVSPFVAAYMYLLFIRLREARGAFVFEPETKTKVAYIGTALLGFILMPAVLLGILFFKFDEIKATITPMNAYEEMSEDEGVIELKP
ncbi:MAG: hypothetical protein Q8P86_03650 [bacterium]|nr:hypothetical protein [bacterium]